MTGFYSCHKTDKKSNGFGDAALTNRDVCMDFEPCFNNVVSVYFKSIKLGQMTTFNVVIFLEVVSVFHQLKF